LAATLKVPAPIVSFAAFVNFLLSNIFQTHDAYDATPTFNWRHHRSI